MRGIRSAISAALTFAVVLSIGAAAASGDQVSDQQDQLRTMVKRNWDQTTGQLPMLDAKNPSRTIDQVISLSLENGNVKLRTAIPSTTPAGQEMARAVRLKIDGQQEWVSLSTVGSADKGWMWGIANDIEFQLKAI